MNSRFGKFLKALYTLSPTGIVTYLSHWQGLLGDVGLAHPDFQPQVERLARGVSALAVLAAYVWLHNSSSRFLRRAFTIAFGLFLASLLVCVFVSIFLGSLTKSAEIEGTIHLWRWFYFLVL